MIRSPAIRIQLEPNELVVDNFAGGGGASTGIETALGRPVDIAINHDPAAIAMHRANHPETYHYCESIWEVDPIAACGGRPVGLAWFSPDCTHFSRAKGTTPLRKETRGLAWVVIRWARTVAPRVILLENVQEFETWGPLDESNRPDPTRKGETFRAWLAQLTDLGYRVEYRALVAADYGTPTTRRRLFLIARRDGAPIVWPEPTHGPGRSAPWRAAAEVIDWCRPCPSIFSRTRPLAEATLRRIAAGLRRYVVDAPQPFIVKYHGGDREFRGQELGEPLRTVDTANRFGLAVPYVVRHGHYSTITGAGLREGCGAGTFRGQSMTGPLATVCATNDKHLVMLFLAKHFGGPNGHSTPGAPATRPLSTITAKDHHGVVAAFLTKFYGTSTGSGMAAPMPTVTAGGGRGGGHLAHVAAFLVKYYGGPDGAAQGQVVGSPLHTITTRARFGLAVVEFGDEQYELVDIGMRMLIPAELFRAQGFPPDYNIEPMFNGKPLTKTAQVALAGNSVCPQVAEALVRANLSQAPRRRPHRQRPQLTIPFELEGVPA